MISSDAPVLMLGGGPVEWPVLQGALTLAEGVVAVDGGADHALAHDLHPAAVIGDLDSLSDKARAAFADRLHRVEEQVTPDVDKALRHINAPVVIGVGFSGGRLDHELAALSTLLAHPMRRCVLVGPETLTFLCPPEITLELAAGDLVSLYPMGEVEVASSGLLWPTDGLIFSPEGRTGTSNEALGGAVSLRASAPRMLVILHRERLPEVVAALMPRAR